MKKTIVICGALLSIALITPAHAVLHTINQIGNTFSPSFKQIEVGDQVQWVQTGGVHTTTSGTSGIANGLWDAPLDGANTSFTHTFNQAGTFPYFCRFHFFVGMTGTIDVIMPTGVRDDQAEEAIPRSAVLYQNFPNPFNAATQIRYDLVDETHVCLTIVDMLGRQVRKLINVSQSPGSYWSTWDGMNDGGDVMASGMYLYRLQMDRAIESKKMILLK